MGTGRKSTDIEVEERIIFLLSLMSKGIKTHSNLFPFFSDKYPDLTERQFRYDLQKAHERIKEHLTEDAELLTSDLLRHLWELYNKAHKENDIRECRNIIKQISELTGANAAAKVELSGKDGQPIIFKEVIYDPEKENGKESTTDYEAGRSDSLPTG